MPLKDQVSKLTTSPSSALGMRALTQVSGDIEVKEEKNVKIFVYGTLKRKALGVEGGKFIGEHRLEGFDLYKISHFPGIVKGNRFVDGEIFEVSRDHLPGLDAYEGVPYLYRRECFTHPEHGVVYYYLYNGNVSDKKLIESGVW